MKKANRQRSEELIRKVEAAYDNAWQSEDIEGIVACFTNDAIIMSPRGDVAHGHEEIRDLFVEFLGGSAKGSRHTSRVARVSFVMDDVAVLMVRRLLRG